MMSAPDEDSPSQTWESLNYEPSLPVSEKSNPLSRDMDRASANQIVRLLQDCDAQMFRKQDASGHYQGILDDAVMRSVMEVSQRVEQILKDPHHSLIVLSGCGTSGRLAYLTATGFNRALKELKQEPVYTYTIAGGDRALLTSQEAPEDDPAAGARCLKEVCEGKKRVLYIGISCGLSAPFVAGQLDFCLQHLDMFTPVLIGFNPEHQARADPMRGCSFSFRDVVRRMMKVAPDREALVVLPVVGPEAVSGSSRMKGGSTTKILLEVILKSAHDAAFTQRPVTLQVIRDHVDVYSKCVDIAYSQPELIADMMKSAGESLQRGGRVCYLGWGRLGVLGLIDASECVPTFGADYNDIRGFVSGGYGALNNKDGPLASLGPHYCISHEDFSQTVLPSLSDRDTVILIYTCLDDDSEVSKMAAEVRARSCKLLSIAHGFDGKATFEEVGVRSFCSSSERDRCLQWELSTKLTLNAVSTGAHVLKGKVYQNYMIDLQVTNSKLYQRATRLLQKLSGRPEEQCEEALLRAVYEVEDLSGFAFGDICAHTKTAAKRNKVVPLALVSLLAGRSLAEAQSSLDSQPVVRDAVAACLVQRN